MSMDEYCRRNGRQKAKKPANNALDQDSEALLHTAMIPRACG